MWGRGHVAAWTCVSATVIVSVSRPEDNMKTTTVSLLLGLSSLLLEFGQIVSAGSSPKPVSLHLSTNLQQIFSGNTVYLRCEGDESVDIKIWPPIKYELGLFGRPTGRCGDHLFSACYLSSPLETRLFWCETRDGRRSEQVNITMVSPDRPLILEIPALPVTAGSEVTLRCRAKDGSAPAAYFFKNGVRVGGETSASEQQTLSEVQASDEGFYSCSTDTLQSSPQSWLRVKGSSPTTAEAPPSVPPAPPISPSAPPTSVLPLFDSWFKYLYQHLWSSPVCCCCSCTGIVLMVFKWCCKKREKKRRL